MLRQKSLCIMKSIQKERPVLSRNCSVKQIKVAPITNRVTSPYSKDKNNKQSVGRSISHSNKQKMKEKCEAKVQLPKQQKSRYEESKTSIMNHINIKKDLKLLISKTLGNASKKTELTHKDQKQSKQKINTSSKIDEKTLKKKEDPVFTKRHSICNLKVIKQQKYSKLKTSKASLSKISKTNSKQKGTGHDHDNKQAKKKEEQPKVSGSASARFSIDSNLTSTLKSQLQASQLCFGSSTKKEAYESKRSNERPNFLEFFKKYRNSFDLKGIKHSENDKSKLKQAKNMNSAISLQAYKSNFQNTLKQKTQQSNRDQLIEFKQAKGNEGAQKSTINQTQSEITCNNHSKMLGKQAKILNSPDAQRLTSETPEISTHNQAKISYKIEQNSNGLAIIPKNYTVFGQLQKETSQQIIQFQSFYQEVREKNNEHKKTLKQYQSPLKQSFEHTNKPAIKNFGQSKYYVPQIPAFRQKQVKNFLDLESPIPKRNLDDSIEEMQQVNIKFGAEQFQL